MSFLDRIQACNNLNPAEFLPFRVADQRVGLIRPEFAQQLQRWPEVFTVDGQSVQLHPKLDSFEARTDAVSVVNHQLMDENVIQRRAVEEPYGVTTGTRDSALFTMDRAASAHYGIRAYGQHLNGYVLTDKGMKMWVGIRARDKPNEPGKYDQIVAGGLPHTLSLEENLLKECAEEAGMPPSLALQAAPCGEISYQAQTAEGAKPDTMYCYDLELPQDFEPRCTDGEVDAFELLPIEEVAHIVEHSSRFKLNCNLVIIDFLLRHGHLEQSHPEYAALKTGLHQ